MKITDVKTFLIHPGAGKNWLFVKVETDEGIHGWGEAYTQADRDRSIEITVQQLRRYLIGRSPFDIKHFTFMAYTDFATRRGSMEFYCAVSGIEHALWDIAGKAVGQPVYNLLGGATRTQIRVYANGWGGNSLDKLVDAAKGVVARGFTAMKFDPFPDPWRAYISRRDEDIAVERVAAVREAVGPDVEILVEVHRRLAPMHAVRVARRMEPYRPFWYEEPVSSRDMAGLAEAAHCYWRRAIYQSRVPRRFRAARGGHHQPGRVQLWRNPGTARDRGDGRGLSHCRLAPQLQQHDHRPGGDGPRRGWDAEFSDR
jgi:galactonate dehydratase